MLGSSSSLNIAIDLVDIEPVEDLEPLSGLVDFLGQYGGEFEVDNIACLFHWCCRHLLAVVEFCDECNLHKRFSLSTIHNFQHNWTSN